MKPRILVCNDDGIDGIGLRPLVAAMRRVGNVTVVVPSQERSADSHSLTLHKPIRIQRRGPNVYALNGKPADCARLGILEIMKERVDLVVSGINRGYNLGEDVVYSGTVAAAREATLNGVQAIAFSQDPEAGSYKEAAAFAGRLARLVLKKKLPPGICLNVNVPAAARPIRCAVAAPLGRRIYSKEVTQRADPRGGDYYWLAGSSVTSVPSKGTDVAVVAEGHISVTPLHIDCTDQAMLLQLRGWKL
jgi:5'-nucleotidase